MKRTIVISAVLLFSLSLVACFETIETIDDTSRNDMSITSTAANTTIDKMTTAQTTTTAESTTTEATTTTEKATTTAPTTISTTTKETTQTVPAGTTVATSAATEATTTEATTEETSKEYNLFLISKTNTVLPGEMATLEIQGKPNTEYIIKVYYSSGASSADGLEPKKSNASGYVTWTWKVGVRTKPGDYHIDVIGGGETLKIDFTVG